MNIDNFVLKPKRKGTGSVMIRLGPELEKWLATEADNRNISLNKLIVAILIAYEAEALEKKK